MIQTPFQIMSGWPVKFRNNKVDNPAQFLNDLERFQRGYRISETDTLENIDAILAEEALEWCKTVRDNWFSLYDFQAEFKKAFLDKKFLKEIATKIRFQNQKEGEEIQTFLIGIRKLFAKQFPRKGLEWELNKTYENLRIEYKMYIRSNDFQTFEELESLGKEFEMQLNASKIRGQQLQITFENGKNSSKFQKSGNYGQQNQKPQGNYYQKNWYQNQKAKITFPPETESENDTKMIENVQNRSESNNYLPNEKKTQENQQNPKNSKKQPIKCYGCGKLGHIRKVCRTNPPPGNE